MATTATEKKYVPRLKTRYRDFVVQEMIKKFQLRNAMQVPRLVKIVVNIGVSEAKENIQALETAKEELTRVAGQLPEIRRAKKSIATFKLRQGMPIGLRVTLRRDRMYDFLDRLNSLAIPRIRDFRGLNPGGFDGHGNYNLGLSEQLIFPEMQVEQPVKARGMNITIVTDAGNDQKARSLLELMGLPFRKVSN